MYWRFGVRSYTAEGGLGDAATGPQRSQFDTISRDVLCPPSTVFGGPIKEDLAVYKSTQLPDVLHNRTKWNFAHGISYLRLRSERVHVGRNSLGELERGVQR